MVDTAQVINAFLQPYIVIADDGRLLASNLDKFDVAFVKNNSDSTHMPSKDSVWLDTLVPDFEEQVYPFWQAFKSQPAKTRQSHSFTLASVVYQCVWHRLEHKSGLKVSALLIKATPNIDHHNPKRVTMSNIALVEKQYLLESRIADTKRDLNHSINTLEALQEELHTTTEELMASNEELISSNEELQVMNEELVRLNHLHLEKFEDLVKLHHRYEYALSAYDIPMLFVDEDGDIRRFTPKLKALFAIDEVDIGRSLSDINHVFECQDFSRVLATSVAQLRSVQELVTKQQQSWLMTINQNNIENGWILTFVATEHIEKKRQLQTILDALPQHIALLSETGTVLYTNRAWRRFAQANGVTDPNYTGVGESYLAACRVADNYPDPSARRCYHQLSSLLAGQINTFNMIYPCHSPSERRWFSLQVVQISGVSKVKAVISHHNLTAFIKQ